MQETWVQSLGQEDPLEKEMSIHSSTIAWKIPWTEEPGRLQSMGSQRVGHDWVTSLSLSPEPCQGQVPWGKAWPPSFREKSCVPGEPDWKEALGWGWGAQSSCSLHPACLRPHLGQEPSLAITHWWARPSFQPPASWATWTSHSASLCSLQTTAHTHGGYSTNPCHAFLP